MSHSAQPGSSKSLAVSGGGRKTTQKWVSAEHTLCLKGCLHFIFLSELQWKKKGKMFQLMLKKKKRLKLKQIETDRKGNMYLDQSKAALKSCLSFNLHLMGQSK